MSPSRKCIIRCSMDSNQNIIGENVETISTVSRESARDYAKVVIGKSETRGWIENYRYKITENANGTMIVFVDGSMNRSMTRTILNTSAIVLTVSAGIIMVIILLLSKRAVRPMAESYEKQKQFITDANHELKTPLTLILTNLDIVESELGHSEWIDDIRSEGKRMNGLVEQLTALSRLDEDKSEMSCSDFSISEVCNDTVSEFSQLVESKGLSMSCDIEADVNCCGDEAAIRRLIAILLDNAVKYCSANGNISLSLEQKKHTVITVENSCATVDSMELDRLFDRFYRADKARTAGNSFGIGLSLAKSITEKHHGSIKAYKAGPERIGFRATIK